jgi:hypothetical protein
MVDAGPGRPTASSRSGLEERVVALPGKVVRNEVVQHDHLGLGPVHLPELAADT